MAKKGSLLVGSVYGNQHESYHHQSQTPSLLSALSYAQFPALPIPLQSNAVVPGSKKKHEMQVVSFLEYNILYYQRKQCNIKGNSIEISIHLHCFIPPKWA